MKFLKLGLAAWTYLCLATFLAESGVVLALWQRGQLNIHTIENLLVVAYDIPVRQIHDELLEKSKPATVESVPMNELESARTLTALDLDLREMFTDKGMFDLRDLETLLEQEKEQNARVKDEFDRNWALLLNGASDSELQDVRRQIESASPKLAKDQLLRILNDPKLNPDQALDNVVTIFKSLPIDKRKKIVMEFKDSDTASLHEILRQIRLGEPQTTLIRETRERMMAARQQN